MVLSLAACELLVLPLGAEEDPTPVGLLNGGWLVHVDAFSPCDQGFHTFTFSGLGASPDGYEISDAEGNVFERATINDTGFTYTIDEQTNFPDLVGSESYMTYIITGDVLRLDVYDDDTLETLFVQFRAERI